MSIKTVHDLGGSSELVEILAERGAVRGLANWPAALAHVRAGNVDRFPDARGLWATYRLSDRGRRRRAKFWGRFA